MMRRHLTTSLVAIITVTGCVSPQPKPSATPTTFCAMAKAHNNTYAIADPTNDQANIGIQELAAAAPAEIKKDMETMAALVKGVNEGRTDLPDAGTASEHVLAYLTTVCHTTPSQ